MDNTATQRQGETEQRGIMSDIAIKKLEEQLNCAICLDIYTEPKLLQCLHVYCRKCLMKLVIGNEQKQLSLTCPTCRQVTPVPANGVTGLQSAFQTNEILQIRSDLIKSRDTAASLEGTEIDTTPLTPSSVPNCFEHNGKEVELYCETCGELICYKCILKGGKHEGHDYDDLKNAYERYKEEVTPSLEPMEGKLNTVKKALAQLGTRCEEIFDKQVDMEVTIRDTISQLHEFLDVRKTELIRQLHRMTRGKLKSLAIQRDKIKTIQEQLSSCLDFVRKSVKTKSLEEVLIMKSNTVKQINELIAPYQPDVLKPNTEADIVFSASPDITTACHNYGKVYVPGEPDPSQCQATGRGLSVAAVGEKSTAIMQAISYNGEAYEKSVKPFECELVSEITGATVKGQYREKSTEPV